MGILRDPQACLRRMLSKCHALQTWNGATYTEAQLLTRIYLDVMPDPANGSTHTPDELNALRPFIVVGVSGQNPVVMKRDAMGGGGGAYDLSGSLVIMLEQNAVGDDEAEVDANFIDLLERMFYTGNDAQPGLMDLTGLADSIAIKTINLEVIARSQPDEIVSFGDAQFARIRIDWGT